MMIGPESTGPDHHIRLAAGQLRFEKGGVEN